MPDIIQFYHPNGQYQINKKNCSRYCWNSKYTNGMYLWNRKSHCRKFLHSIGDYIDKNNILVSEKHLLFWGEWEPCSHFQLLQNCSFGDFYPHHIHSPIYCLYKSGTNTDPLVFGKDFFYSNCNKKVQKLDLSYGSIILFGTNYLDPCNGKPCFVLDTVFIVERKSPYSVVNGNISGINYNPGHILYDVTLSTMEKGKYNLYTGINYLNNKDYFSFVPVKEDTQNSYGGFERVKFYHTAKRGKYSMNGLKTNSQGFAYIQKNAKGNQCEKFWDSLINKIHSQGFELGVRFEIPPPPKNNSCCCGIIPISQDQKQKDKCFEDSSGGKSC